MLLIGLEELISSPRGQSCVTEVVEELRIDGSGFCACASFNEFVR